MDKPKKQKKKIIEIPQYNDPMNKEGIIPTDVLGSYSVSYTHLTLPTILLV